MNAHSDPSIDLIVELAALSSDDRVIDVGAGAGVAAFAVARDVASVDAVDNRPETIDEARRLNLEAGAENVTFSLVDFYALPYPDGEFSLAVCRNAIHRLPEPVMALAEMVRVVAPGGRLIVSDIVVDEQLDRYINELARLSDHAHRRHCTHDEFLDQFVQAGLRVSDERQARRTVDLDFWLEAAAVDADRAELIHTRLQEFPLKIQTAIDLAVADRLVSFSYDVAAFRLEH